MSWKLDYSKESDKFLKKKPANEETLKEALKNFIRYLDGETVTIILEN
jgi:hypothetical protein